MISTFDDVTKEELQEKQVPFIRKTTHQKVLVFDLDETLAHTTVNDTQEEQE